MRLAMGWRWHKVLWVVLAFALLAFGAIRSGWAQQMPNAFQDVPAGNWAYTALASLQKEDAIPGYPSDYFAGKQLRSRYELAVALKRALDRLSISPATTHVTNKDVDALKRLVGEFEQELKMLGESRSTADASVAAIAQYLEKALTTQPTPQQQSPPALPPLAPTLLSIPASEGRSANSRASRGSSLSPGGLLSFPIALDAVPAFQAPVPSSSDGIAFQLSLVRDAQLKMQLINTSLSNPLLPYNGQRFSYDTRVIYQPFSHITLQAEALRGMASVLRQGTNYGLLENNAYRLGLGYENGAASADLGFQVVEPQLTGNTALASSLLLSQNGVLLEGPFTSLSLRLSSTLRSYVGGEFLLNANAKNALSDMFLNGIYRGQAGVLWNPLPGLQLRAGVESIYYDLTSTSLGGRIFSSQQLFTLGAGLNLTRNAMLQLLYQYGNSPTSLLDSSHTTGNSVFTTQLAIHF